MNTTLDPRTHARRDDPATSHIAAASLSDKKTMLRRLLQAYGTYGPMTAEEAASRAGFGPESGAWKRVSDLTNKGLLEALPDRVRIGRSGRPQQIREITEAGRKELAR